MTELFYSIILLNVIHMSFGLSYDKEKNIIKGYIIGKIDTAQVKEMSLELSELFKKHNCNRLLNDHREASLTKSAYEIYRIPRIVSESGVPLTSKRALVVTKITDDYKFMETTSINIGQQVKVFTDYDEAIQWLTE